ncbi:MULTISPECIES: GerMN domain-containing protein [Anaerostipes]|uniref:GerMN domain-containing protein n=1 Tax=Anaerostipes TaxID=207244 RepID=UPI0009536785|nr:MULTISPECIES: GerMN domain-containing protein [Anaerostipes]MCI5623717.1 GerMN domain-containing protein [Anaerostipes sp.]OLR58657.1 spore gernimation protein [Anaerostipes sp. 494a]
MMKKKKIIAFLCCLCLMFVFSGCRSEKKTKKTDKQEGVAVYYTDKDCTRLISVKKKISSTDNRQQKVELLLKEMQTNRKDSMYKSAIPKRVIMNNVTVSSNVVSIDFSTGYKKIAENEDLICRAGIVYTLTQLEDINYVSFSVSGKAMLDTDGKAIGALGRDSFVFGELPMK